MIAPSTITRNSDSFETCYKYLISDIIIQAFRDAEAFEGKPKPLRKLDESYVRWKFRLEKYREFQVQAQEAKDFIMSDRLNDFTKFLEVNNAVIRKQFRAKFPILFKDGE